jgi:hypothetical protein
MKAFVLTLCCLIFGIGIVQADNDPEKPHFKKPKRIKVNPADEEYLGLNFTEEFNVYRNTAYSNTHIDFATSTGWAVGLQLLNVPMRNDGGQSFDYDAYIVISKTFKFSEIGSTAIGSQFGTILNHATSPTQLHNFTFVDNQWDLNAWFNCHAGPFYVNDALATIHQPYGVMAGFEVRFLPKQFHLQAEYYSGSSNISGTIVNLVYFPLPSLQTYLGISVPAPHSGNEFAGNLGFIYNLPLVN